MVAVEYISFGILFLLYSSLCVMLGHYRRRDRRRKDVNTREMSQLPRMLAVGLPYNTKDEVIDKMMGSLSVGLKEHVVVSSYTTKDDGIEFLWFEHSGNTLNPYPEAKMVFHESAEILAEKIMRDESLQWQVGKA